MVLIIKSLYIKEETDMKKLFSALLAASLIFSVNAGAADPAELHGTRWTDPAECPQSQNISITGDVTISENTTISSSLVVESDSTLHITSGAELTLKSADIFIEEGGTLLITDGRLDFYSAAFENCGTIIIEKDGTLNISSGTFSSYPSGNICNSGEITCKGRSLTPAFNSVRRYDSRFSLSEYSLYMTVRNAGKSKIEAYYCVGRIQTNYRYTLTPGEKGRIKRSNKALSAVYDVETRNDLLARVESYEKSHPLTDSYTDGCHRRNYYTYVYKTDVLTAERWWFSLVKDEPDPPVIWELGGSEAVTAV